MIPEAQRIAIAEACGWRPVKDSGYTCRVWENGITGAEAFNVGGLPDYLTDLNAMHEAELACIVGNDEREFRYRTALAKVMGNDWALVPFASAAQKAEAFLRTIGRWGDKP